MRPDGTNRRKEPCPCGSGKKYKACCAALGAAPPTTQLSDVAAMLAKAHQSIARRDPEATEFWFRQILAVRPHHAEALAGLGQKRCWDGRVREGLALLQQAAAQLSKHCERTRDINGLTELSDQLHHWGDMETALRLARLAVRLAPNSPVAHNNLALYLSRLNRVDEALPHARKACQLAPEAPACSMLLAQLEVRQGHLTEAKERLRAVISADRSSEHTARCWMELGAVLDKSGDCDQAFVAFSRGTEGLRRLPKALAFDPAQIFRSIDRNRAGFDRALLRRWQREEFADELPGPVFLLGFLRSGTTLTEQILGAHPEVVTSDENGLIHELIGELSRLSGCGDDIPAGLRKIGIEQARGLRRHYWRRMEQEYGPEALQRRFIDKVALNTIDTGLISTLFPDARILFALRDPRDVCLSCFTQAFQPSPATVNLLTWEGIARQYAAVMDLWLQLRDDIAPEYLEMRYEDTVNDFESTYRRVFEFLGIGWTSEVLAFHQKVRGRYIATPSFAAVSQPLFSTSVARWQRYERHFATVLPQLERFVDAFGYRRGMGPDGGADRGQS